MTVYYPPVGFHFKVEVAGFGGDSLDSRFTDVSGLTEELSTEEVAEGGQNRFVQKYPVRAKHNELTLKRGLLKESELIGWVKECIEDFSISPRNIDIKLLNAEHEPLVTWHAETAAESMHLLQFERDVVFEGMFSQVGVGMDAIEGLSR